MANKKRKGKQHASAVEVEEEKPKKSKGEKYFYYFALIGSFADDDDMWLVDSGASSHMTGEHGNVSSMTEKKLS